MQLTQSRTLTSAPLLLAAAATVTVGGWWLHHLRQEQAAHAASTIEPSASTSAEAAEPAADPNLIEFPRESWAAASLEMHPVIQGTLSQTIELTGKIALNEDKLAHIFPLVEGRVEDVRVHFGDRVKKGDLLVVVQSKEVGQAMLQLFQDRQQRDLTAAKDRWTQSVAANTSALIQLIRENTAMDEIEKQLTGRPLGDYRDKLMTAYIDEYKTRKQLDRLAPLNQDGAITGRQLLQAEAEWNAARATLQSLIEQIQQDAQQAATHSAQSVKDLQTRVAVDLAALKILGLDDSDVSTIDPSKQGEALAHYPVRAPFDGTIIDKDVVLYERVSPDQQMLSVADLSTVWVTADLFEEHLPLLAQLDQQTIHLRASAWPDKVFDALAKPWKLVGSVDCVKCTTIGAYIKLCCKNASVAIPAGEPT